MGGDTVDTSTVGQYTVTYDCTDSSNNEATQVSRTVNVQSAPDTDAPVIIITGSANIQLTVDDTYTEQGATCDDDVDADKPATVGGDTVDTSTVGQYTVTYDCTDSSNNEATQVSRTVNVQSAPDTDAPVIIITGSANIQLTVDETYTEQGAVCDDDVDADKPATVGGDTVDTSTVGQYTVTYDCTDSSNNEATQVSRTVNVQSAPDTDAPVIIITGSANIQLTVDETYTEQGAVCDDDVDADKPATVGGDTVDTSTVGQYTVTYDCTDSSNNEATQVSRTVNVQSAPDTDAPVIIITGSANIQLTVDETYTEQGAVCDDDVDADKPATVGGDTVDTSTVGQYTVTYDCTDSSNNEATQVSRTVNVQSAPDTDAPVIIITGSANIQLTVDETYTEQGAVCDDDVDADKPATVGGDTVDTSTVGQYTVTYDCTDSSNNEATQVSRTVNVQSAPDTDAPVIIITGSANIQLTVDETYTEQGAVCDDDVDADKPATVGGDTVDTSTVGQYTVTYDCTDSSNNEATQVSRTVNVQSAPDTDAPVIIITGSANIQLTVVETYTEQGAVCDDDVDADKPATVGGDTVDTSTVGQYTVTYDCTDSSNNEATQVSRTVIVQTAVTPRITLSADAFITTWRTDSANQTITIPVGGSTARYSIDWGDNSPAETDITGDSTHTYREADSYTVSISGGLERFHLDGQQPNAGRLASIEQWGDTRWTTMNGAFDGAANMVYRATDAPNLSGVINMSGMFGGASSFNGDLSSWDVSSVTDMSDMFFEASSFNGDLSSWDVSAVTNMSSMFDNAYDFNGNLSSWDVSAVTDMSNMFFYAISFNQPHNDWDVSSVTDMSRMFAGAISFDQPLNSWNVSAVNDMRGMFQTASSFNQPLNSWNVSAVTNMKRMFNSASSFNGNLGNWYITLDNASVTGILQAVGNITPQNEFLATHEPTYGIGSSSDSEHFGINGAALVLMTIPDANPAIVNITSTGDFGTSNSRIFEITILPGVADTTNPRLASIERSSPTSQNTDSQSLIYEVTFSESVTGVTSSDFILSLVGSNAGIGSITGISGSGSVYYVTVSAAQDGTYNLDLVSSGHGIRDAANNLLNNTTPTTGTDETYTVSTAVIDNTNPRLASIERYNPATENTDSQTLVYKATFSEDVTGVTASDFTLSSDSAGGESTSTSTGQFTQTRSPNLTIPDLATVSDTITVPDSETATSVSVEVDITHNYIGDLKIDIIAPDGTSITLHDNSGGSTDNIDQPYAPLFGSIPISGVWTLQIHDRTAPDPGVLNSWTLTINYGTTTTVSPVTDISGSGDVYYVTVSATQDGTYNLDLVSSDHNIVDAANNSLTNTATTGADQTYTVSTAVIDNTNPRLASIERYTPATENTDNQTLVYKATFSEDVTGVTASDFVLSPSSTGRVSGTTQVTGISGSGDTYYVTVSSSTDGTYNLDLVSSDHNIVDAANNSLTNTATTGADQTYTVSTAVIDNTNPRLASIERYNPATENTDSQTLVYKATFSEDVTGVTVSDFTLSSDSAGGESTSTSTGQFTQTRSPNLTIPDLATVSDTITVPDSETATSVSVEVDITHNYIGDLKIDIIAPDGTSITLHDNSGGSTDNIDQPYAPLFGSIPISGVWTLQIHDRDAPDPGVLNSWTLTINYGTTTTVSPVTDISGSGDVYYVTVSATQDGTYNLDLVSSDHNIVDAANNSLTNTATTGADQTYTVSTAVIDNTNPRLASIERYNPATENTDNQTLVYKATFSEDVTGVTASDFVLSPSSTGRVSGTTQVTGISGSGDTYYVTVSSSTDGTYNLDLVSSDHNIVDAANNSLTNTATTGADQTYTVSTAVIDNTNPRLASIERYNPATENTDSQTLVYKATFSEDVTGVTVSDFTLSSDSAGGESTSTSTGQFTQTRSPNLTIPDLATVSDTITVPDSETATSVSVEVDITHNYIGDLKIDIIAPDGTSITLHDNSGGSTDNIDQPYAPLFGSIPISGVWTLQIHDRTAPDPGVLNSWTLTINYGTTTTVSPVTDISGSGDVYYVTVSATQDGTYNLDLVSSDHNIVDAANNSLTNTATTGADQTYTVSTAVIDNTNPRLASIERYNPATENTDNQTLVYKATFSEDVTGVTASDFVLSPSSTGRVSGTTQVTGISGSGDTYYVTVSSSTDGTYNLDLVSSDHNIVDAANNSLTNTATTGADQTYTVSTAVIDNTNPRLASIERYNPATENTDSQTLVYKATFSEDVTGVTVSDFTLSSDSAGGESTSTSTGQFTQTRSPNLTIPDLATVSDTITVPDSETATSVSVEVDITHNYIGDLKIDIIAPDGTSITLHDNSGGSTDNIDQPYAPLFGSIPISGVWTLQIHDRTAPDPGVLNSWTLTINYGTTTTVSPVTDISGSGDVYYVTVSATQDGTYNLDLVSSDHNIVDAANNSLTNTATTGADQTYTVSTAVIDNTNPRLASIERYNPATENTDNQTLVYKATFSEDVTGVTASDFVLSPSSTGRVSGTTQVTGISGSGDTYYVTVSSSTDGTYNLDLVSSDHNIVDAANNSLTNTATTGADQTYTVSTAVIDNTNPRLASIERYNPATENTDSQTLVYKATFSEDVTGVTVSDFTLSSDSAGGESTSTSTGQFTQTRSPNLTIPDLATVSDTITVPDSETATSVSVEVDITHNYIGDLKIDIIAPDGTSITLHDNSGGSTDNIDQPYAPLFGSIPISGVWTLQIHDNYDADPGVLNSWTLTINYSTTTTVSPVTGISGSGDVYYVTVSATQDGTYNLDLVSSDHNIVDAANNSLTNTATTGADQTYTVSTAVIDNTNPRLASIERSSPTSQNTDSQSLLYKATFSEDVMGVTASDFVLSPSSTGRVSGTTQVTGISGSGDVYYVTVSATQDGTYNLDLVSSDHNIVDAANNSLINTATTGADQTYTVSTAVIDNTNPRLASIERYTPATENTDSQTLVYKATFSEDVTGVTVSDFTLSSDSAGGESTSTSTGQFTQTRSPNLTIPDLTTVSDTITVPDSETATSVSVEVDITHNYIGDLKIDIIAPDGTSITLHDNSGGSTDNIDQPYAPLFGSIPISGVWTLQIHDRDAPDPGVLNSWTLTINYGTTTTVSPVTDISGSGDVYYVTVSATQDGTYNLDLVSSDHNIVDAANNSLTNTATTGADQTYTVSTAVIDNTNPRLASIERYSPTSQNTNSQFLIYKATFSENVTGVGASDFVLSPGSTGGGNNGISPIDGITGSGDTYYVIVFPAVDGTYNLDLVSSGHNIADAANNSLTNTVPITGIDQTYTKI